MKTKTLILLASCFALPLAATRAAEPAPSAAAKVGVYDSRAVAFAHFWSEPVRTARDDLIARAKAAQAANDTAQLKQLKAQIQAGQKQSHLAVFSTGPADEAMAALKDKLPTVQRELGVARLVSKWDERALREIPETDRVDATDRLVHELLPSPTEKQTKTIEQMKAAKPLPLWQAKLLLFFGGM